MAGAQKADSWVSSVATTMMSILVINSINVGVEGAYWCVVRSDASDQALQTALDYACGMGADCTPILSNGLCYLPNTIQAHASYAFNSFFQRKAMAPGSCDFSGTATIAQTDPSMFFSFSAVWWPVALLIMCNLFIPFGSCVLGTVRRLWILCLSFFLKVCALNHFLFFLSFFMKSFLHLHAKGSAFLFFFFFWVGGRKGKDLE
jgi:hypothetical protein